MRKALGLFAGFAALFASTPPVVANRTRTEEPLRPRLPRPEPKPRKGFVRPETFTYNLDAEGYVTNYKEKIVFSCDAKDLDAAGKKFRKWRRNHPLVIAVVLLLSVLAQSCYTSGYGCRGNSRIITRVR